MLRFEDSRRQGIGRIGRPDSYGGLGDDRPALAKACSDFEALVLEHSTSWKVLHSADNTVSLFLLKFPEEPNSP